MKKSRMFSLVATIGATATIFGLTSCGEKTQQMGDMTPEIATITVAEGTSDLASNYAATIKGKTDIDVRPLVSGFITKVHVDEGQRVSKGQTLFTLDQVQYQAAVDQTLAQVNAARTAVESARLTADNKQRLFDKNIISAPAYQTSVDALNAAKAQYNAALANLTSARKNLSYTNVTAPISGVIGSIDFKEGSLVSPQTLLTVVSNNADMQANFSFNEKDILAMTDNGRCSIDEAIRQLPPVTLLMANGERYGIPGKVTAVSGVIDSNTGSASAKAIFRNPDGMLHSGNTGQILMPSVRQNAMLVPQSATYEVQDMKFVYVVGDSNKVHSRAIQITEDNDGKNYIVTGGLKPGETIVVEGVGITVKDNMQIKPKK